MLLIKSHPCVCEPSTPSTIKEISALPEWSRSECMCLSIGESSILYTCSSYLVVLTIFRKLYIPPRKC